METHGVVIFRASTVCLCFLEGERANYSEDKETRQTRTKPNEQAGLKSPSFFLGS